jgi:peptidoglycan/LPS O-acetylase OafA/YrhL
MIDASALANRLSERGAEAGGGLRRPSERHAVIMLCAVLAGFAAAICGVYASCSQAFEPPVAVLLTGLISLCLIAFLGKGVRHLAT